MPLLNLIIDKAAGEPCGRADAGAESGITGNGANDRASTGSNSGPREGPLLRRRHVRTACQRHDNRRSENERSHRARRRLGASAAQGYLPAR